MITRDCLNSDCRGDCDTCNRARVENRPLPHQSVVPPEALEASMMRVRNGACTVEDGERLMSALQCALAELDRGLEDRRPALAN